LTSYFRRGDATLSGLNDAAYTKQMVNFLMTQAGGADRYVEVTLLSRRLSPLGEATQDVVSGFFEPGALNALRRASRPSSASTTFATLRRTRRPARAAASSEESSMAVRGLHA
jgi:hypothetical protein